MKFIKKIALVFVLLITCFTFSACSWWNFGDSNNGGGNGGNNSGTNTPGDVSGGYDPEGMLAQIPTINAIAGVYVPEISEISAENIVARDAIYTGVKDVVAGAITVPDVPEKVDSETAEQTLARVEATKAHATQLAKQNAVKLAVDTFTSDANLTLDRVKYGFFASEVEALVTAIGAVSGTTPVTIDGTTTTEAYAVSDAELGAIKTAIKNYLTNANNVPGMPVEGETGEFAGVRVAPIVEIQIFYVKTFEVTLTLEGSTISTTSNVEYLDDENGYSTRFEDKDNDADRKILPSRKWLTFYYAITPGSEGHFCFQSVNSVITFNKDADNAEDLKNALLNYTGTITAKSNYTSISYAQGLTNYSYNFSEYHAQTVEEQIEEMKQSMKDAGLSENYEVDEDTRAQMQEDYETSIALYGGYCQFNLDCFDGSKPIDERAPKFSQTKIDDLTTNKDYVKAIVYVKADSSYGIESRADGIANTLAINIKTNGATLVPFGVENLEITAAPHNKQASDGLQ